MKSTRGFILTIFLCFPFLGNSTSLLNDNESLIVSQLVDKLEIRQIILVSFNKTITDVKKFSLQNIPATILDDKELFFYILPILSERKYYINIGIICKEQNMD